MSCKVENVMEIGKGEGEVTCSDHLWDERKIMHDIASKIHYLCFDLTQMYTMSSTQSRIRYSSSACYTDFVIFCFWS